MHAVHPSAVPVSLSACMQFTSAVPVSLSACMQFTSAVPVSLSGVCHLRTSGAAHLRRVGVPRGRPGRQLLCGREGPMPGADRPWTHPVAYPFDSQCHPPLPSPPIQAIKTKAERKSSRAAAGGSSPKASPKGSPEGSPLGARARSPEARSPEARSPGGSSPKAARTGEAGRTEVLGTLETWGFFGEKALVKSEVRSAPDAARAHRTSQHRCCCCR